MCKLKTVLVCVNQKSTWVMLNTNTHPKNRPQQSSTSTSFVLSSLCTKLCCVTVCYCHYRHLHINTSPYLQLCVQLQLYTFRGVPPPPQSTVVFPFKDCWFISALKRSLPKARKHMQHPECITESKFKSFFVWNYVVSLLSCFGKRGDFFRRSLLNVTDLEEWSLILSLYKPSEQCRFWHFFEKLWTCSLAASGNFPLSFTDLQWFWQDPSVKLWLEMKGSLINVWHVSSMCT